MVLHGQLVAVGIVTYSTIILACFVRVLVVDQTPGVTITPPTLIADVRSGVIRIARIPVLFRAGLFTLGRVLQLVPPAASPFGGGEGLHSTHGHVPAHLHQRLDLLVKFLDLGPVLLMNSLMVHQLFVDFECFPTF